MKLKITYNNGRTKIININLDCSTEELIHKFEKWEYRDDVLRVEVID